MRPDSFGRRGELEREIESGDLDVGERIDRMHVLAQLLVQELGDLDAAIGVHARILEIDDTDQLAFAALESLYLASGRFRELLDVYARQADLATDDAALIAIHTKIAHLCENQLGDEQQALAARQLIRDLGG